MAKSSTHIESICTRLLLQQLLWQLSALQCQSPPSFIHTHVNECHTLYAMFRSVYVGWLSVHHSHELGVVSTLTSPPPAPSRPLWQQTLWSLYALQEPMTSARRQLPMTEFADLTPCKTGHTAYIDGDESSLRWRVSESSEHWAIFLRMLPKPGD